MTTTLEDATRSFYDALNTMLGGDAGPMLDLWSRAGDVTYMSPFGELLVGWEPIEASSPPQPEAQLAGRVDPARLPHAESAGLGVAAGLARGSVRIEGQDTPVNIRATSTWRLEDGAWRMIGHHTDPLG